MFDNKINWRKREIVLVNPDPTFEKEADYNKSVVLHGPNSPRYAVFSEPIHIAWEKLVLLLERGENIKS